MKFRHLALAYGALSILLLIVTVVSRNWLANEPILSHFLEVPEGVDQTLMAGLRHEANLKLSDAKKVRDFWNSFLASFWQDMVFFGTLGLVAMIFSRRSPKQDDLETRVGVVFSASDSRLEVQPHLLQAIKALAIYVRDSHTTITFTERQGDIFRMEVDQQHTMENLFANETLHGVEIDIIASGDAEWPNGAGYWGGVRKVNFRTEGKDVGPTINHEQFKDGGIAKTLKINIEKDSHVEKHGRFSREVQR